MRPQLDPNKGTAQGKKRKNTLPIVPVAEPYQPRVTVVQAAGEAEGCREGRVGVLQNVAE